MESIVLISDNIILQIDGKLVYLKPQEEVWLDF